jgi:hypothetical protein
LSKTANSSEWQDRTILWVGGTFAQSFSGEPSTDRAGSVDAAVALDEGQGVQEIGNLLGIRASKPTVGWPSTVAGSFVCRS